MLPEILFLMMTHLKAGSLNCEIHPDRSSMDIAAILESPVSESCPATILRKRRSATLFVEQSSAQKIRL